MAEFSVTFLGTGTSVGVPVIGCDCSVCHSEDSRNKRFRSSVVVRVGEVTLLVDSGPDLRMQALREGLREIDAVIYTHGHLDHVAGFDELRAFCWRRQEPLPMHATPGCMATLQAMYPWAFFPKKIHSGYVRPDPQVIEGTFSYGHLSVTPLPVEHGSVETVGFLFEMEGRRRLAYIPDVKCIPETTLKRLEEVDVLIIDALRPVPHPSHFSLEEALAASSAVNAQETWLTHVTHDYDAVSIDETLPGGVRMAWDGLRVVL
jgi:phosphoribosyl 1,2-cyclic phosphate phosphodiesterase